MEKMQTILFADIAGSTRLYEQLGDAQARSLIARCLDKLTEQTIARQGSVIKTIGDEIMCTFNLPDQAVAAAFLMHEEIAAEKVLSSYRMQLRIGLHHGPIIQEDADIYGDAVNIAARLVGQAKAGQIITCDRTVALLRRRYQSAARLVDQTRIKGKQKPMEIYELLWGHPEELTMITTITCHQGASDSKIALRLQYMSSVLSVDREHPVITMGRDAANDIVLNDPKVSRVHARIELRKDKFELVDQSTNGTFIFLKDGQSILLRRDEITLPEEGIVVLGEKTTSDESLNIRFRRS